MPKYRNPNISWALRLKLASQLVNPKVSGKQSLKFHWVKGWRFCLGQQSKLYPHPICVSEDHKKACRLCGGQRKTFKSQCLLLQCVFQGLNSGSQVQQKALKLTEPFASPSLMCVFIYLILICVLRINLCSPVECCPESCELLQKMTPLKGWGDSWDCQSVVSDLETSNSCQMPDGREVLWAVKVRSWYWLWVVNVRTELK